VSWLVVDTSVVSYILKKHSLAPDYWKILKGRPLAISFMTVAELYRWPLQRNWSDRRTDQLHQHIRGYTLLRHTIAMSREWAKIKCRRGHPISDSDAWIAATALLYEIPLVTHNPRHFLHIDGLRILTVGP
jgi:tRNA(fMet)-specific endonuclease VapC